MGLADLEGGGERGRRRRRRRRRGRRVQGRGINLARPGLRCDLYGLSGADIRHQAERLTQFFANG
jgi:hypothetical protein